MSTYLSPQEYAKDVEPRLREAEFTTKQTDALTRAFTSQYQILTEMNERLGSIETTLNKLAKKLGVEEDLPEAGSFLGEADLGEATL